MMGNLYFISLDAYLRVIILYHRLIMIISLGWRCTEAERYVKIPKWISD